MDLDHAVQAHAEWKVKFRSAIAKQEQMDAATISTDNHCPLGLWLHGEARGRYAALKSYSDCVHRHAGFHKEAGRVAQAINAKKYAEAEAMIGGGTPYGAASSSVAVAILALKKEAGI